MIKSFEQFLTEALSLKKSDKGEHFLERVERRLAGLKVIGVKPDKSDKIVKLDEKTTNEIEHFFRKTLSTLADPKSSALFKETTILPANIGLVLMARPQVILPDGVVVTPVFSVYERKEGSNKINREGSYFWIMTIGSEVRTVLLHSGDGRSPSQLEAILDRSVSHLISARSAEVARLSRISGIDFTQGRKIKSAHQVVTDTIGGRFLTLDLSLEKNYRNQAEDTLRKFTEIETTPTLDSKRGETYSKQDSSKQMTVSPRTWLMEKNLTFGAWGALPVLKSKLVKGVTGNEIWLEVGDKWVYWLEDKKGNKLPPTFNPPRPSQFRVIKKGDTINLAKEIGNGEYLINTGIVSEISIDSANAKYPYFKTEKWNLSEVITAEKAADIFRRKLPIIESFALNFKDWQKFTF
jgi:hypothetical protein